MRGLCLLAWMMLGCGLTYPTNPGVRDATADTRDGDANIVADTGPCGMPGERCCPTMSGMDGGVVPDAGPQGNGCVTGANCSNGVCMTCPAGRIVCNNDCVDPTQNANCGACGAMCDAGTACMRAGGGGVPSCQLVCPGQTACGGRCADTMTDPMNCGACGRVCNSINATNTCVMGQCRFACNAGFANCDSMMTTGCEANLQTDVNNCMTCGRRCMLDNATSACVMGQCRVGTCNVGFEDCDGDPANGCEANINTTVAHCGRCGMRCTPPAGRMSVCVNGGCGIAGDCAMPTADCDGNQSCETNTNTSPMHCGGCGRPCNSTGGTATCTNGACGIMCSPGLGNCDNNASNGCETNTNTSTAHCGRCGGACNLANATAACTGGTCVVMECRAGFADCDRNPANGCEQATTTDNANCGGCGIRCRGGEVCSNGTCRCSVAGTTHCEAANQCFNLTSDTNNCGTCGTVCGVTGQVCQMGTCLCPSSIPTTCGSVCANTTNDVNNCGACGTRCMLANASSACAAGQCVVITCGANFGNCNGNNTDGCESDFRTDSNNCGRCGVLCGVGRFCSAGTCVVGTCGSPGAPACPPGNTCTASTNCSGTCRDLQNDNANCGACGRVCGAGQTCCAGTCRALATDTSNCGMCGMVCPTPSNATATCTTGACGIACTTGFANCNGNTADGCETNLALPATCGSCSNACNLPNVATETCTASVCGVGTCATNFGNCDSMASNGCETDLRTTTTHCGMCGMACTAGSRMNVTPTCSGGMCQFPCQSGFADCNGNMNDGCEANLGAPTTCGMCSNACNSTGGTATCMSGTCGITCAANFGNCDSNVANGCETDLRTTTAHCGMCGMACTGGRVCTNGACACPSGQALCGTSCFDLQTSASHCGMCNRACPTGQSCVNGSCTIVCAAGQTLCSGLCVNTAVDLANCGMCGRICSSANGTASCSSGTCGIMCSAGFGNCDGNVMNGCEANFNTSSSHCGGCAGSGGMACPSGQTCTSGMCCPTGQTVCGGMCVDTHTSNSHCGGCAGAGGTACTSGRVCTGGACACPSGQTLCSGACVDTQTSAAHCGGCGAACAAGATCSGGMCSCGTNGQSCCASNVCGANLICNTTSMMCQGCGGMGETCCPTNVCRMGTCQGSAGVGGAGTCQ